MQLLSSLVLSTSLIANVFAVPPSSFARRDSTSFVAAERAIALQGALNNIGPNGSAVPGAGAGFVVASPSKVDPDCEFCLLDFRQDEKSPRLQFILYSKSLEGAPVNENQNSRFLHLDP